MTDLSPSGRCFAERSALREPHAFLNSHDGVTGWVMARIGMKYHEPSAADTRSRIVDFFGRHLNQ